MFNNARGKNFVVIMLVIVLCALVLRGVIGQVIKISIIQNEQDASAVLKLISTALENYAKDHQGLYPQSFSVLIAGFPPYLDKDYITQSPLKGYNYDCSTLTPLGYSCSAVPLKCGLSGKLTYTVITGGSLINEECAKKE